MKMRAGKAPLILLIFWATLWAMVLRGAPAQNALEQARLEFEAGHYAQAASQLNAAMANNPPSGPLYYWLARCHFELNEFDAAVSSAERAVQLDPTNSDYHLLLGRAYGRKAETVGLIGAFSLAKKSRREFEEATRLNPSNFPAQHDLIEFYLRAPMMVGGGDEKALRQIAIVEKLDAAEGHRSRGEYWSDKKKYEQADSEYRLAIQSANVSADVCFDAAEFYDRRKNATGLQAAMECAARTAPGDPRLLYYRGALEVLSGTQLDDAEHALRQYLETIAPRSDRPTQCPAREWLGLLYEREGKKDLAREQYRTALAQDPHCKGAHDALHHLQK